jgi:hypothetical protein
MQFRPSKKRIDGDLTDIEGHDLLHLFHGLVAGVDPDKLVDRQRRKYLQIDSIDPFGRSVLVTTETGNFGEEGKTFDVDTHAVSHKRGANESATIPTRTLLVVPPGATTALFLIERQGQANGGSELVDLLHGALLNAFPDHFFPTETMYEADAWAEGTELLSVTAIAHAFPVDISASVASVPKSVGTLRQTLTPSNGNRLPHWLWEALRNRKVDASNFIGFAGHEVDETEVQVIRNGQKRPTSSAKRRRPQLG